MKTVFVENIRGMILNEIHTLNVQQRFVGDGETALGAVENFLLEGGVA